MSRIDTLMKRFRSIAQPKTHERVLTRTSKLEVMTSTQAVRFRHLKGMRTGVTKKQNVEQTKPHYALPEASRKLGVPVKRILQSAAAGKLTCYVLSSGVHGNWHVDAPRTEGAKLPQYLAVKADDCRAIETWGSVNVHELLNAGQRGDEAAERPRFLLREPLWVDPERLVLLHPLPETRAV